MPILIMREKSVSEDDAFILATAIERLEKLVEKRHPSTPLIINIDNVVDVVWTPFSAVNVLPYASRDGKQEGIKINLDSDTDNFLVGGTALPDACATCIRAGLHKPYTRGIEDGKCHWIRTAEKDPNNKLGCHAFRVFEAMKEMMEMLAGSEQNKEKSSEKL
jgi:hypothetical protein